MSELIEKDTTKLRWKILVGGGYGEFDFVGTEQEAETMRSNKANWEHAIARKRLDSDYYSNLESELARLREAIRNADHECDCASILWDEEGPYLWDDHKCTCIIGKLNRAALEGGE